MTRRTSKEAYDTIKQNGLLSQRRWEAYDLLFRFGPATAMELNQHSRFSGRVDSQIRARLNELAKAAVAYEVRERVCSITGMKVIEWDLNDRLPINVRKPRRITCKHCHGKGYTIDLQMKFSDLI